LARLNVIEHALDEYLRSGTAEDYQIAAELRAVPLYRGWTGTIFLTTSGAFLFRDEERDPVSIRTESDRALQVLALAEGAQQFPILVNLLPKRGRDGRDCDECGGTGRIQLRNTTSWMYCGKCHGLGWPSELPEPLIVPQVGSAEASYLPFDEALAKFVAFAASQGISGDPVFISADSVREPDQNAARDRAKQAYEEAARRRLGVAIFAVVLSETSFGVCVCGPKDADEAERLLFPDGLKLSVPK
jgi:hypothetical protein